jgi:hypothetical protein
MYYISSISCFPSSACTALYHVMAPSKFSGQYKSCIGLYSYKLVCTSYTSMYQYTLVCTKMYLLHTRTYQYIRVNTRTVFFTHFKKIQTGLKPAIFCIPLADSERTPALREHRPQRWINSEVSSMFIFLAICHLS